MRSFVSALAIETAKLSGQLRILNNRLLIFIKMHKLKCNFRLLITVQYNWLICVRLLKRFQGRKTALYGIKVEKLYN